MVEVSLPPVTSVRLPDKMEIEELCAIDLVLVMMTRTLVERRNGLRRRRRVPRWWMQPWIRDRLLEGQLNTAYKLQRQLAYVSRTKIWLKKVIEKYRF